MPAGRTGKGCNEDHVPVVPGEVHDCRREGRGQDRQDQVQEVRRDHRRQRFGWARDPIAGPPASSALLAAPPGDDDEGDGATRVFTEGAPVGGSEEWTVNVTDEDQRTLTAAQILDEYQRGVVTDDTYVWKDGMTDWLPLSGVPELTRLVAGRGAAPAPRPAAGMPIAAPAPVAAPAPAIPAMPPGGLGGTMMMTEPVASPFAAASPAAVAAISGGGAPPAAGPPAAARRSGKAGGVDLFAPGQQHPEAAAAAASSAASSADRHVGERNENSVLFSISALTASAGASKHSDDPFDLGAPPPRNGRGKVDDIMNLGGGGMGSGPMLAPPPLLAPVVEAPPPPPPPVVQQSYAAPTAPMSTGGPGMAMSQVAPDHPQSKSKTPLILGIIGAVVVLGGAGVFFATRGGGSTPSGSPDSANTATIAPTQTAAPTPTQVAATPQPGTPDRSQARRSRRHRGDPHDRRCRRERRQARPRWPHRQAGSQGCRSQARPQGCRSQTRPQARAQARPQGCRAGRQRQGLRSRRSVGSAGWGVRRRPWLQEG